MTEFEQIIANDIRKNFHSLIEKGWIVAEVTYFDSGRGLGVSCELSNGTNVRLEISLYSPINNEGYYPENNVINNIVANGSYENHLLQSCTSIICDIEEDCPFIDVIKNVMDHDDIVEIKYFKSSNRLILSYYDDDDYDELMRIVKPLIVFN